MTAAKSNKTKKNKELSAIEKKLLGCDSSYKPVLLYGKRPVDFKAIVRNIYDCVGRDLEYVDCDGMDGDDFHKKLVRYQSPKYPPEAGYVCYQTCTFFFDNLCYYPENDGQYNKAAKVITNRKFQTSSLMQFVPGKDYNDVELTIIDEKVNLLEIVYGVDRVIAYTDDIKPFPRYFRKQFKKIPLDGESREGEEREGGIKSGNNKKKVKEIKKTNKLEGRKKHYAPPDKREELIKKYLKECPEDTRHVIASKVKRDLEKEGGRPLQISTLKKEISKYRGKENVK